MAVCALCQREITECKVCEGAKCTPGCADREEDGCLCEDDEKDGDGELNDGEEEEREEKVKDEDEDE